MSEQKKPKSYDKLLKVLQGASKPLSLKQWADAAKVDKSLIWRYSKIMLVAGDIVKLAPLDTGMGVRYKAITGQTVELKAVNNPISLNHIDLLQLLVTWSKQTWDPKAFKSARSLPVGLATLFGLAVEASYGSRVSQDDLEAVRRNLDEFLDDLQNLIKVVAGVLATHPIWNEQTFVEHLLKDKDPDQIQEYVHRVRELN